MNTSFSVRAGLLMVLLAGQSCDRLRTEPCTFPRQVTADSQCYAGRGLQLTAGDYGDNPLSFVWHVYALNDTSRTSGWSAKDEKIKIFASSTFVVPDSLVATYQRLVVSASANCGGLLKQSIYYSFVKRQSTAGNCVTWSVQNQ